MPQFLVLSGGGTVTGLGAAECQDVKICGEEFIWVLLLH